MSPGMWFHIQNPANKVVSGLCVSESYVFSPYIVNKYILCNNATQRQAQRIGVKGNTSSNSVTLASSLLFPPSSVATNTFPCIFHIHGIFLSQAIPITECVILESQEEPHLMLSDPPALHLLTLRKASHLYRYIHPGCCPWPLAVDDISVQICLPCRLLLHMYTHPLCCSYPGTYIIHIAPAQEHIPCLPLLPRYTHPGCCSCPGTHTLHSASAQVHTPCMQLLPRYTHPTFCSCPGTHTMPAVPAQVHTPCMLPLPRYTHLACCPCPGSHTLPAAPAQVYTPWILLLPRYTSCRCCFLIPSLIIQSISPAIRQVPHVRLQRKACHSSCKWEQAQGSEFIVNTS